MKQGLLIISIILSMTLISVNSVNAEQMIEMTEIESQQIKIELQDAFLYISGAAGKTLYIYNVVGMKLMAIKIDSSEKKIDLSDYKKKVVLVKIGNISKKINLPSR